MSWATMRNDVLEYSKQNNPTQPAPSTPAGFTLINNRLIPTGMIELNRHLPPAQPNETSMDTLKKMLEGDPITRGKDTSRLLSITQQYLAGTCNYETFLQIQAQEMKRLTFEQIGTKKDTRNAKATFIVKQKFLIQEMKKKEELLESGITEIASILRISETSKHAMQDISPKELQEEQANQRKRLIDELLNDPELNGTKKTQSKKPAKKNLKTPLPKKNSEPIFAAPSSSTPLPTSEERRSAYLLNLFNRPSLKEHFRVTGRWKSKDLAQIRSFEDHLANQKVKRYAHMNEKELFFMRACHYLPGTEKIFADEKDRKIYTFPSKQGLGMISQLQIGEENHYGILYFGIGNDKIIFHRFFEVCDPASIVNAFRAGPQEMSKAIELRDASWVSTTDYQFTLSKKGVITVSFPDEEHTMQIFPVRKDLLDPILFA